MLKSWLLKGFLVWVFIFSLMLLTPIYKTTSHFYDLVSSGVYSNMREGKLTAFRSLIGNAIYPVRKFLAETLSNGSESRLPRVDLYISERSQKALRADIPQSTKIWQPAKLGYPNQQLYDVKVRNRGENPADFMFNKKSWKLKTSKKHLYRGLREYSYHVPRTEAAIEPLISFWIADELGVQTPNPRLIEMFINGSSNGILLEMATLNEGFLRKNGYMPVTIYKLDRDPGRISNGTTDGMQNPRRWKKLSTNNRHSNDERPLLEFFVKKYNEAWWDEKAFSELKRIAPFETWSKFSAYDIIADHFHSGGDNGNTRLIADDQSGRVVPIVWDPLLYSKLYHDPHTAKANSFSAINPKTKIKDKDGKIERQFARCSWDTICLYKKNSEFRLLELRTVFNAIAKQDVINAVSTKFDLVKEQHFNSLKYDLNRTNLMPNIRDLMRVSVNPLSTRQKVDLIFRGMENYTQSLKTSLSQNPNVQWSNSEDGFSIFLQGPIPVDGVTLNVSGNIGDLYLDTNFNGLIDAEDILIPCFRSPNQIKLNATWLANLRFDDAIPFPRTKFRLIAREPYSVKSIAVRNALTNKIYDGVKAVDFEASLPDRMNIPQVKKREPEFIFNPVTLIEENTVFTENVRILKGTKVSIAAGKSVVFRGKLHIEGTNEFPVSITSHGTEPFGAIAIHGNDAANSTIKNLIISNGSGGHVDGTEYLSMFSINDTENIEINNLSMRNNKLVDDMLHIVYGTNIALTDIHMQNSNIDAIDIDLSTVKINNLKVNNAGNDCLDLMSSTVELSNSKLTNCLDKGVSVGEKSKIFILNSVISDSFIGVESKDNSVALILFSNLIKNKTHLSLYNKNWRYGKKGSIIEVEKSYFSDAFDFMKVAKRSKIVIEDSTIVGNFKNSSRLDLGPLNDNFNTKKMKDKNYSIAKKWLFEIPDIRAFNNRGMN